MKNWPSSLGKLLFNTVNSDCEFQILVEAPKNESGKIKKPNL